MRAATRITCLLLALAIAPTCTFGKDVKVEKKKPEIERKTIDPNNPPALKPGEDALTLCDFSCEVELDIEGKPVEKPSEQGCEVTITVSVASVTVDLTITEWLPKDAPAQLKEHEDGHAEICEKAYEGAKKAAEEAAKKFGKRTFTGKGKTCELAREDAQKQATNAFCSEYHEKTQKVAQSVSDIYDQLTDHGKNDKPKPGEAVKKAFEKQEEKQKDEHKKK